jgi:hypothetical protein
LEGGTAATAAVLSCAASKLQSKKHFSEIMTRTFPEGFALTRLDFSQSPQGIAQHSVSAVTSVEHGARTFSLVQLQCQWSDTEE